MNMIQRDEGLALVAKRLRDTCKSLPPASRQLICDGPVPYGRSKSLRPDGNTLNPGIPLFLIGKSKDGFWVAREENGCAGGTFFTERGARHFAKRRTSPRGYATVAFSDPMELDFKDDGNAFISLIRALKSEVANRIPEPVLDIMTVVLGLAAMAIAVWLVIAFLTFGA